MIKHNSPKCTSIIALFLTGPFCSKLHHYNDTHSLYVYTCMPCFKLVVCVYVYVAVTGADNDTDWSVITF